MDDAKKLIHWALNSRDQLKVELTSFNWPQQFGLNDSDFHFKFILNDKKFEGRGMGLSSEIALTKAIVESIERTAIESNSLKNSNGVAAHFNIKSAREHALCELIERDIFFCSYLLKKTGVREVDNAFIPDRFLKSLDIFSSKGVTFKFFDLGSLLQRQVVLVIANGFNALNPFGCVIGLGASNVLQEAIGSAFLETARSAVTYIADEVCTFWEMNSADFFNNDNVGILEHKRLALSSEYSKWLWEYYQEKVQLPFMNSSVAEKEISFELLSIPKQFANIGITVSRARSSHLQNLFFGKTQMSSINFERLEHYSNSRITVNDINFLTHPLS